MDVTGLRGDVTGISDNLDICGLTESDRQTWVDIQDLILDNYKIM